MVLRYNNEISVDRKEDKTDVDPDPDEEEIEDVILYNGRELH